LAAVAVIVATIVVARIYGSPLRRDAKQNDVRTYGRIANGECEWSGCLAEARFVGGSGVVLALTDQAGANVMAVEIDGTMRRWFLSAGENNRTFDVDPQLHEHHVVILKDTEAALGRIKLRKFAATSGELISTERKRHRVQFIGDSVTCGYGALGTDPCDFSPATESFSAAFPTIVGRALEADVAAVCYSGIGVARNGDGGEVNTMPHLYDRLFPADASQVARDETPDVIVVELGTNDYLKGIPPSNFDEVLGRFLDHLRDRFALANILVLAGGPVLVGDRASVEADAVERAITQRVRGGDLSMTIVRLPTVSNTGCKGHPSAAEHAELAHLVEVAIRDRTHWL